MLDHEFDQERLEILVCDICEEVNSILDSIGFDVLDIEYISLMVNEDLIDDEELYCLAHLLVEETDIEVAIEGFYDIEHKSIIIGVKFFDVDEIQTNLGNLEV